MKNFIKEIKYKNKIFALIIDKKNFKKKGINFFTDNNMDLQLGFMKHNKGHIILPHKHNRNKRVLTKTTEIIYIIKGELRVDFYSLKTKYIFSEKIKEGSILMLIEGAHGFKVSKDIEMIEVKQGPFIKSKDKKKFKAIDEKKIKFK
ncbi:hypothetical protein N8012_01335 [Pelagibacteraceae bacterium]|nr:hypothetical protein [Pelagibacteraceae bacterium]